MQVGTPTGYPRMSLRRGGQPRETALSKGRMLSLAAKLGEVREGAAVRWGSCAAASTQRTWRSGRGAWLGCEPWWSCCLFRPILHFQAELTVIRSTEFWSLLAWRVYKDFEALSRSRLCLFSSTSSSSSSTECWSAPISSSLRAS